MTRFLKSAYQRVMARFARPVQTTERRGPSRKMKGVSTVEYALILVAVVAIVGASAAYLSGQFDLLLEDLGEELTEQRDVVDDLAPDGTP